MKNLKKRIRRSSETKTRRSRSDIQKKWSWGNHITIDFFLLSQRYDVAFFTLVIIVQKSLRNVIESASDYNWMFVWSFGGSCFFMVRHFVRRYLSHIFHRNACIQKWKRLNHHSSCPLDQILNEVFNFFLSRCCPCPFLFDLSAMPHKHTHLTYIEESIVNAYYLLMNDVFCGGVRCIDALISYTSNKLDIAPNIHIHLIFGKISWSNKRRGYAYCHIH